MALSAALQCEGFKSLFPHFSNRSRNTADLFFSFLNQHLECSCVAPHRSLANGLAVGEGVVGQGCQELLAFLVGHLFERALRVTKFSTAEVAAEYAPIYCLHPRSCGKDSRLQDEGYTSLSSKALEQDTAIIATFRRMWTSQLLRLLYLDFAAAGAR